VAIENAQWDSKCLEQCVRDVGVRGLIVKQWSRYGWPVKDHIPEAEHHCEGVPKTDILAGLSHCDLVDGIGIERLEEKTAEVFAIVMNTPEVAGELRQVWSKGLAHSIPWDAG
jgi:hypothetical protein